MLALLGAWAYVLIAWSLGRSAGQYDAVALGLMAGGLVLVSAAVLARCLPHRDRCCGIGAMYVFAAVVALEVYFLPLRSATGPLLLLAGVTSLAYLADLRSRFAFPLVLALYAAATGLSLRVARPPDIDVWHFQSLAAEHLLSGRNPYSQTYVNIYTDERFYGEKLLVDGRVRSFPYPPTSLFLIVPGQLAGDVRWSLWLALLLSAWLMVETGRGLGLAAGHRAELIAVAVLLYPLNLFLVGQAWTETLLALFVVLLYWLQASGRQHLVWLAAAGVLSVKQYGLLLLVPLWLSGRLGARQTALAVALALVTGLPFLLWDFDGFVWGNLWFHVHNIFRSDALSLPAMSYHLGGPQPPAWIAFVAAGSFALIVNLGRRGSLAHAAMSAAGILLVFFLFNKGAFLNYYWLVLFLVGLACLLGVAESQAATGEASAADVAVRSRTPG